ncbi:4-hydroxyphenylpyruvate dioxygenase [candidate division KSB1 bacterium]|nr:4-hydroxyphenylpyruvate dioxygenase [candidate division KSB1 bacterium]
MEQEGDFVKINKVDHVEFYVGNAKQATFYWSHLGFEPVAYTGLETGNRRYASWLMEQGKIRILLTSAYDPHDPITAHCMLHGDGVKVIALEVDDVEQVWCETIKRGAVGVHAPNDHVDRNGRLRTAAIQCYGQTLIKFVERKSYQGAFMPTFEAIESPIKVQAAGLQAIDHIVGNVELGKMNEWVEWFHKVLGFRQIVHYDDKVIHTEYSALMSKVMANGNSRIKFPINEPAQGRKKSQIEEYIQFYNGPGVQHLALITGDIIKTVRHLRDQGIEFLRVPDVYYDALPERIGKINESYKDIKELGILADRDDEGYLLQIFTRPIQDRPTVFLEIIQRRGSRGFGVGNFKALFESIEIEQARRGNL